MPTTISQGLTTPAGLVNGSTAQASHVSDLYTAMNAFVIPDSVLPVSLLYSDNTITTCTVGASDSVTWTFTIPAASCGMILVPFTGTGDPGGATTGHVHLSLGGSDTGGYATICPVTVSANGMICILVGPRGGATGYPTVPLIPVYWSTSVASITGFSGVTSCIAGDINSMTFLLHSSGSPANAVAKFGNVRVYLFGG